MGACRSGAAHSTRNSTPIGKRANPSYGETKRLILSGATESLETQMEKESRAIAAMAASVDGREGIAAFIDKRTPEFQRK